MRAFEEYGFKSSPNPTLSQVYIAGFGAGIACFLASTPTELVKCRAQVYPNSSTWEIFKSILFSQGIRGKIIYKYSVSDMTSNWIFKKRKIMRSLTGTLNIIIISFFII